MTDAAQAVLLVLAGLLIGILVPLIVSARALIKRTDRMLEQLEPKLDQTLDELQKLVRRSDELVGTVQPAAPKLAVLADRLDRFADGLEGARPSSALARAAGSALGAALVAAWNAYVAHRQAAEAPSEGVEEWDEEWDHEESHSEAHPMREPVARGSDDVSAGSSPRAGEHPDERSLAPSKRGARSGATPPADAVVADTRLAGAPPEAARGGSSAL